MVGVQRGMCVQGSVGTSGEEHPWGYHWNCSPGAGGIAECHSPESFLKVFSSQPLCGLAGQLPPQPPAAAPAPMDPWSCVTGSDEWHLPPSDHR